MDEELISLPKILKKTGLMQKTILSMINHLALPTPIKEKYLNYRTLP